MVSHADIDRRSRDLARAVVSRIDADPTRAGLERARSNCRRWLSRGPQPAVEEWLCILDAPWEQVRTVLLDGSEEGQRLRQSTPFCGILTPRERWQFYRKGGRQ
jgi:hypothetical protein